MASLEQDEPFIHVIARGDQYDVQGTPMLERGLRIRVGNTDRPAPGYAKWRWDGESLIIENCRYGLRPWYYFVDSRGVCVSPSILQLLRRGAPAELDEPAIAVFVRLGTYLGNDTPFRHIRAVPPNSRFRWTREGLEIGESLPVVRPKHVSRDDAIDEFNHLFEQSIQRRAPTEPFMLPLSGGRDSRQILFALMAAGYRPQLCVTARHYPPRSDEDARIAKLIAQHFGIAHSTIEQEKSRVAAEVRKNFLTNFCALEHAWTVCVGDWLSSRTNLIYDGLGGDILTAAAQQDAERNRLAAKGNVNGLAENLLDHFSGQFAVSEEGLRAILKNDWERRLGRQVALSRLIAEINRHLDAPQPLTSFLFWNRMRRTIGQYTFGILSDISVHCPYLDDEIYEHMMALPVEYVADHKFHTEAILRAYPHHRHIPFEDASATQPPSREYWRGFGAELTGWLTRHGPSNVVNRAFLIPRMIRCALTGNGKREGWFPSLVALYLVQIEALTRLNSAKSELNGSQAAC